MARKPKIEMDDVPTEADIARGDAVLRRMLQTKPKPHKEMVGKSTKKAQHSTKTRSTNGAG